MMVMMVSVLKIVINIFDIRVMVERLSRSRSMKWCCRRRVECLEEWVLLLSVVVGADKQ